MVGRLVLVTNGVYRTGSVDLNGRNRVALTNAVILRSVNGPSVTLIEGALGPTDSPWESIRCVYVGDAALVSGFTLTNGGAADAGGGGVYCEPFGSVTNCVLTGNSALYGNGGGAYGGMLNDCALIGNSADSGGGAINCTLNNCTLTGNTASGNYSSGGGGALNCTLNNCTLTGNSADRGGGVNDSTLFNCVVMNNTARQGGGVGVSSFGGPGNGFGSAALYNCTVAGNTAEEGGGAYGGGVASRGGVALYNCIVMGNTARHGGGTAGGKLYNCVVKENSADAAGGVTGVYGNPWFLNPPPYYQAELRNCIVYYNQALSGSNYGSASFEYSCTTPLPEGTGNIAAAPQLTWDNHLLPTSPCVGAGSTNYVTGRDLDGEPWANPPCMGVDQIVPGPVTGPLTLQIHSDSSQVAPGFALTFMAQNTGRLVALVWDFGDGTFATNQPHINHTWETPGIYTVRLTGYNDSFPAGVTTTAQVEVITAVYYVNQSSPASAYPYTNWATAATNIQDAVAAGNGVGRLVLVTNGVYRTGVAMANGTNRVALTNTLVLRSVNGPAATIIDGDGSVRCAYLGPNTVISGFTLTNGAAETGGGVWCANLAVISAWPKTPVF